MAHLSLSLFGGCDVLLDGRPISGLKSNKVRALLAYLAVEADRLHRREALAGLLWPDSPDVAALNSLRNALANLRRTLGDAQAGPPTFLVTRETIRCDPAADVWADVTEFERRLADGKPQIPDSGDSSSAVSHLHSAISLYRGPLLAGFSVESTLFEEWAVYKREQFQRQAVEALHTLTAYHEAAGEYAAARDFAQQQLAIEPYDEEARRQLMRVLVLSGQRGAALAQYKACRSLLAAELGVKPARETTVLYERIRDGLFDGTIVETSRRDVSTVPPVFVAREPELTRLHDHLATALAGGGHVVFIAGDAGSGKTALAREFARQAMAAHGNLLVATGNCSAQASIGDPYLPFVEILQLLTGDIEAKRAGGAVSPEHARRLWEALPDTLKVLTDAGPDLIGRFVPAAPLALRGGDERHPQSPWRQRLAVLVERAAANDADRPLHQLQKRLLGQATGVLTSLARLHPLLLILDDLQWADAGSTSLLFHLGRRLAGTRILIVGAYRPGDLVAAPSATAEELVPDALFVDTRPPLASVVNELSRLYGDIRVDLAQADSRRFLDAFLDQEPNRLGGAFRAALYRHTGGHALFTVELLRGFQERGDLIHDETGRWIEGPSLNWECLPARVEAVIAEHIGRLSPQCQALLAAASVEGEEFTAEVLARVMGLDEQHVIRQLSGSLCKRERLVYAHSLRQLGDNGRRLSGYRFQHALFQEYLYRSLDAVERARLHEAVGRALESFCAGSEDELETLSPRLAWHFASAGLTDKTIGYLLQAGRRATRLAASEEAIGHLTRGLTLLRALPESAGRGRQEMEFQISLGAALVSTRGWGAEERTAAAARAVELSQRAGELTHILQAMALQADQLRAVGQCDEARALAEQMLVLAGHTGEPLHLVLGHYSLGVSLYFCGELAAARVHLEQCIAQGDAPGLHGLTRLFGADLEILGLSVLAGALWGLGYTEQALRCSQKALSRAETLAQPLGVGLALILTGLPVATWRGDDRAVREHLDVLAKIGEGQQKALFPVWQAIYGGWLQARRGETDAAIAALRQAAATWTASGTRLGGPLQLALLAEAYLYSGQAAAGLAAITDALDLIQQTGVRLYEAECWRLRGELLQADDRPRTAAEPQTAEECFERAIGVARRQGAKRWELHATVGLCRLWQREGRAAAARESLAQIYHWFTEGLELPDLREARALLAELEATAAAPPPPVGLPAAGVTAIEES